MDRLNQLRGEAGGSRDSTLDTSSPPSEAFMTANESSKYFSLSEDSEFDISPIKDVSLAAAAPDRTATDNQLMPNLSPIGKKADLLDSYKIGKQIEAANILSGGVDIFDDNDNSNDGNELIIDDNVDEDKCNELMLVDTAEFKGDEETLENVETDTASKDTEVVLQIDGKNVDAIDIGNGLYLYRKEGEEELAAVQIIDDDQQQPNFKFLKVRENAEGNLEVYEEIQIEVPKEVPAKEGKSTDKNISQVPIKDINKVIMTEPTSNIVADKKVKTPQKENLATPKELDTESNKDLQSESNFNGKMKFCEARKSPVIGSFTPMTYHSTPNKEGKPLTKTMVDLQLHPSRHSDNVKKTIEVHTDNSKQKTEAPCKNTKDVNDSKSPENKAEKDGCESKSSEHKVEAKKPEKNVSELQNIEPKVSENKETAKNKTEVNDDTNNANSQNTEASQQDKPVLDLPKESSTPEKLEVKDHGDKKEGTKDNGDKKEEVKDYGGKIGERPNIDIKPGESLPSQSNLHVKDCVKVDKNIDKNTKILVPASTDVETVSSSTEKDDITLSITENKYTKISKHEEARTLVEKQPKVDEVSSSQEIQIPQKLESVTIESVQSIVQSKDSKKMQIVSLEIQGQSNKEEEANKQGKLKENKSESYTKSESPSKAIPESSQSNVTKGSASTKLTIILPNVNTKEEIVSNEFSTVSNETKPETVTKETDQHNKLIVNETSSIVKLIENSNKSIEVNKMVAQGTVVEKKEIPKPNKPVTVKPINNNHAAVPFGKWTEANRQDFLNKIKESKVPTNHSNGKQIKNSNDLNRRDILKKIDSQRSNIATAKAQEMANIAKLGQGVKKEAPIFMNKTAVPQDTKIPLKSEDLKTKPVIITKKATKQETDIKPVVLKLTSEPPTTATSTINIAKKEPRKEIHNQDLIEKTIDDIINRSLTGKGPEETNQNVVKESVETSKLDVKPIKPIEKKEIESKPIGKPMPVHRPKPIEKPKIVEKLKPIEILKPIEKSKPVTTHNMTKPGPNTLLDDIEKEMNKLHGIPFVERPPHELPQVSHKQSFKTYGKSENDKAAKQSKVPKLLPFVNKGQQKVVKESTVDLDSEEEIIEHEPITGDIELNKRENHTKLTTAPVSLLPAAPITDASKKEAIITENEFDKFARRNSKTYENCLKVNFDGSESHNVIQTVVEKDNLKISSKPETKHEPSNAQSAKLYNTMFSDNDANSNYPSKVKMAYQSVMTAKRQLERPITIIEDKPVKVMYVDSNMDYYPSTHVQSKELAPPRKLTPEIEANAISSCDSLDSDIMEIPDDLKSQDEIKSKTKHQRKQILTPVETPELELIEPEDLGFLVSPKKKRRTDDSRIEKSPKALVPKKSYLLGRSVEDKAAKTVDLSQSSYKPVTREEPPKTHNAASAIDSLVKAAALIETQSENIIKSGTLTDSPNSDTQPVTPVKRGRGRPRKYPLPEGDADKTKTPSPQKKPRLIDAKVKKPVNISDDDDSSEEGMIKENWTMGKINENILCPICSKLFRSENVVFKHVKHCTGPSPNRSDSDNRSPRRGRFSQESESTDSKFDETDLEPLISEKTSPKKRKSKDSPPKAVEKDDIIVIEDTPIKEILEKRELKTHESRKLIKKVPDKVNNLVCEICGKAFRQLSYLVSHKLQHAKEERKKVEPAQVPTKSVFSCDVCKKEFRKLHHLVQHRIIHNPNAMPSRSSRKSSSEQKDNKVEKEQVPKQSDDPSAGFRCEPCDKSFRKLHHLVEHRETHDGINRQKSTTVPPVSEKTEKLPPPPQCEVCKKTFRKLHHLIEHKEQHVETSSEKSDDKSVKSSLSTKDIIHECSLCYMVFPNEHSLMKHTVICQRKKKQAATKALKQTEEGSNAEKEEKDHNVSIIPKPDDDIEEVVEITEQKSEFPSISQPEPDRKSTETKISNVPEKNSQITSEIEKPKSVLEKETKKETVTTETVPKPVKEVRKDTESACKVLEETEIPAKIKKSEEKKDTGKTPKKKTPVKGKFATVTKRQKSINAPLPIIEEAKPVESSDDDEVRYMLNPDFKVEETTEGKIFMNVRAKKRNSLQIERPNSKDLVKRRISFQHPPKIPRLKPKPVEPKVATATAPVKTAPKVEDPVASTDSDDSDVKYSFPKTVVEKSKPAQEPAKEGKKVPRQSLAEKRKSIGGMAKRKSIGKVITAKHKVKPSPVKAIKRRAAEVAHRCDCGQLFSSAALLARHTSLAHTPPRIRRVRAADGAARPARTQPGKSTPSDSRKSSTRSETKAERNTPKTEAKKSEARKSAAHRGVPVPEKMRKLMEKNK